MTRSCLPIASTALATLLLSLNARAVDKDFTETRDGVTIIYRDNTQALNKGMRDKILETFFHAYSQERVDFNPAAPTKAIVTIDPDYNGIAYVSSDNWAKMTINPAWLIKHPDDTDLVSHEAMHIVQSYPDYGDTQSPSWLVEGIADYARNRYGINNAASGWKLPTEIKDKQNYDSGYRVTAAFLEWGDAQYPGLVKKLDTALRAGKYSPPLWDQLTGKNLSALWAQYVDARGGVKQS